MSTILPVPLRFALPDPSWEPREPLSLGVTNAAFLAVRRGLGGSYSPTLTISGDWRLDDATLAQIADESLVKLRAQATDVELLKRTEVGSAAAPAITQSLGAMVTVDGTTHDLVQAQALMELRDVDEPAKRAVVIHSLTCTYQQFPDMVREFQTYMASVEVVEDDGVVAARPGGG